MSIKDMWVGLVVGIIAVLWYTLSLFSNDKKNDDTFQETVTVEMATEEIIELGTVYEVSYSAPPYDRTIVQVGNTKPYGYYVITNQISIPRAAKLSIVKEPARPKIGRTNYHNFYLNGEMVKGAWIRMPIGITVTN